MTLASTKSSITLIGNGVNKSWDFDFTVWAAGQVAVWVLDPDGGATEITSNLTVALNADQATNPGGTVVYPVSGSAIAAGYSLSILRNMGFVQPVDLQKNQGFDPTVLESAMDQATAERQQLKEALGRTVSSAPGQTPENFLTTLTSLRDAAAAQVPLAAEQVALAAAQVPLAAEQVALAAAQVPLAAEQVALAAAQRALAETAATDAGISAVAASAAAATLNLPAITAADVKRSLAVNVGGTGYDLTGVAANHIGTQGGLGFGVGVYPAGIPSGFFELSGTADPASPNYGNYQYLDGSIMCWIPAFYYRIGHASNPTYATYLLNSIDIKPESYFADVAAANAAGYALHRAFRDGGATKRGFFVDKYLCSNNGGKASSVRNGLPLSSNSAHNPFAGLTGAPANTYAGAIDAAKTRGTMFACCSRFIHAALALLSMAHAQASVNTTFCAWYDTTYNFPKGNNNNALKDTNDATVTYVSDGYPNCGKTGSGVPFEKTTHNGQASGVTDLNGNMYEVSLGLTRPGTTSTEAINDALGTTKFHILKESVALANLTSGWNTGNDHWGTDAFLDTNFQEIDLPHITVTGGWTYLGNGANQVLSEAVSGNNWLMTGLGIHKDANGASAGGTNIFGTDGIYRYHASNLCGLSGGLWNNAALAGVWLAHLASSRSSSDAYVGLRAACYFV
jgi:hypothetical protein